MKSQSLHRPKLKTLLVSLLAGLLFNVMIAWSFALVPQTKKRVASQPQVGFPEFPWPTGAPIDDSSVCYQEVRHEYAGLTRIGYTSGYWQKRSNFDAIAISCQYGFPARSLEYNVFHNFPDTNGVIVWGALDISAAHKLLGFSNKLQAALPTQPRTLGFTINTFVYALPVYGIWIGVSTLRKRRRLSSSKCTQCGYNVSGVAQCPECGQVVPNGLTGSAPTDSAAPESVGSSSPGSPSR